MFVVSISGIPQKRYSIFLRLSLLPPPATVSWELDAAIAGVDPARHAVLTVDISLRVPMATSMAVKGCTHRGDDVYCGVGSMQT